MLFSSLRTRLSRLLSHSSVPRSPGRRRLDPPPRIEALEDRTAPATFTVTNTLDSGMGSLRQALLDTNDSGDPANTIRFAIDSGVQTIQPSSALPTVTRPVVIDGTSQPGYAGTPLIELDGSLAGAGANGLRITAGDCTVEGLAINRFGQAGIQIQTGGGNTVQGDYLGIDVTGATALGNGLGLEISSADNRVANNLISGNRVDGVRILAPGGTGNVLVGNFIGTDATGTVSLAAPNSNNGVVITGASNTVGGTDAGAGNLLSGNIQQGVYLNGATATGNVVLGNYIGTDATGTRAIRNGLNGVLITGPSNTIGGSAAGARNVISGNTQQGVFVNGTGATDNLIQGNYIGTDASGTSEVSNGLRGITVANGASNNRIGGTDAGAGNLLSGNLQNGVELTGDSTTGNVLQGNLIGTDATGTRALPNHLRGVGISYGAFNNTVGGTTAGARNIISGNLQNGVLLDANTSGNVVQGNYIGTDVTGTAAVPNQQEGVLLGKTSVAGPITDNLIGGTAPGAGNLISGNHNQGVRINNDQTSGNVVQGNLIGTDATGTVALPNGAQGVLIQGGATANVIGGTDAGAGNLISGNQGTGVEITGNGTTDNVVQGNFIGTDSTGTVALGNGGSGVRILAGAGNNTIGGTTAEAGNLISGNGLDGVTITNAGTAGNQIQGNRIGTDLSGTLNLGNGGNGVAVTGGAHDNGIGGTALGAGNIIGFNGNDGVLINSGADNGILHNSIFDNANLGIELLNGGNNNHPAPQLTSAVAGCGVTTVRGVLAAQASTLYTLEFFVADSSGQGQQFLGSVTVTTDENGLAVFSVDLAGEQPPGQPVTATATDPSNNTSAFCQPVVVTKAGGRHRPGN
jgi:titin